MVKNVIVTGASRGIGFETAKYFCNQGHTVVALARSNSGLNILNNTCRHYKGKLFTLVFNLEHDDYQNTFYDFVKNNLGKIDILVNNAGVILVKKFIDFSDDDFDLLFNVNVKSVFKTIKTLVPVMNNNSHIVNISSMGGFQGSSKFNGLSLYSASKAAVAILSETLAEEFKNNEIKVNALALGAVQTEMFKKAFPDYEAPVSAFDMAEFIASFALTGHKYFNGKILPVSISTP